MLTTIDWNNPVKSTRMVRGKLRTGNSFFVTCPCCGNSRLLRADDAKKAVNRPCQKCHASIAGKQGYKATVRKKGKDFAIECVREYRLGNPSSLELEVMKRLDSAGIRYEREVLLNTDGRHYLIDFVIEGSIALEVQGTWAHQFHAERDYNKAGAIIRAGYTYIDLIESHVEKVVRIVRTHLKGATVYA